MPKMSSISVNVESHYRSSQSMPSINDCGVEILGASKRSAVIVGLLMLLELNVATSPVAFRWLF